MRRCERSWIHHYMEFTKFVEPPGKFHLWTALSILSATLGRRVYMRRGLFTLFPNLYVGLIGPTGLGKSTAGEIGIDHFGPTILNSGSEIMRGKVTSWYLYEWFGQMSQAGMSSIFYLFSSELKTLLGDLNKSELVAMLTDIYGCPSNAEYRTKTHGIIKLKNVYPNLLICSTPEWMTLGISADDVSGGFPGRFIYVCETRTERNFPFPEDFYGVSEVEENKGILMEDLSQIATLEGPVILTDEAKARYTMWYVDRMKVVMDERLRGYFSRKRDHLLKVATLVAVAEGDSLVITDKHLETAESILKGTEGNMVMAFKGIVEDPVLKFRETVLDQVRAEKETTVDKLLRMNSTRLDLESLRRVLDTLSGEGRLKWEPTGQDKHGRARWVVKFTED